MGIDQLTSGGGEWKEDGSGNVVPKDSETVGDGTTSASHQSVNIGGEPVAVESELTPVGIIGSEDSGLVSTNYDVVDWSKADDLVDDDTSKTAESDTVDAVVEWQWGSEFYLMDIRWYGYSNHNGDGEFVVETRDSDGNWTTKVTFSTRGASWSNWASIRQSCYGVRLRTTVLDSYASINYIGEIEIRG